MLKSDFILILFLIFLIKLVFPTRSLNCSDNDHDNKLNFYLSNNYFNETIQNFNVIKKRFVDPTFRGNPKSQAEIWHRNFNTTSKIFDQTLSLVALLNSIAKLYLTSCTPVILYDTHVLLKESFLLQKLLETFPMSYMHGKITINNTLENKDILNPIDVNCRSWILFLQDALITRKIIGPKTEDRVIVIPRSTQWKLQEFLSSPESRDIINLLVIGESFSVDKTKERPYVLYTHQLYTDGLGSNRPIVLTSWIKGRLSRPHVNLFPTKLSKGFSGHRFIVAAANQHPFVFRRKHTNPFGVEEIKWDGIEYRLLSTFAKMLNFTMEIVEPKNLYLGSGDAVMQEIKNGRADIGIGGIYVTSDRIDGADISVLHSTDCAAFITLTSKALPRYRAIMGPFQWPVWVALTAAYLLAIFPLAFSDKLTLHHLLGNFGEVENMFWYVFGTFTNSLTFTGENSWSNTKKTSTRMLIGWYWVFTIIITACYTGSIIAFVTLPVFPETVDNINQLLRGFYRIGTLDRGGWERWFSNSTHEKSSKLLKNLEFVVNIEEGLSNVTKAFFWSYAFLGSRAQLEYIVQSNFSSELGRRSALHISDECFSFFGVSFAYPLNSIYKERLNDAILRYQSSGLMDKVIADVSWTMQRSSSGRLLQASKGSSTKTLQQDERGLTLADTEGMFLLLGIGFVIAGGVLLSEWVGGCTNRCREIIKKRRADKKLEEEEAEEAFHPNSSTKSPRDTSSNLSVDLNIDTASSFSSTEIREDVEVAMKTSHHRSTSVFEANLNRESLLELYNGPKRRHSSIIIMNGEMILESDVNRHLHKTYEKEKNQTKSVDFLNDLDNRINMQQGTGTHKVEINRPPTPFASDIDVEDQFGEKVYH